MSRAPSYPRQSARTRRFTLGAPRAFTVAPDGSRVAFLRSPSGTDPTTGLWVLDVARGVEHHVVDPAALLAGANEDLPPEERARRERTRESAAGVVSYATDDAVGRASFGLSGRAFVADLRGGTTTALATAGPVVDPRLDPTGARVAYVAGGAIRVVDADDAAGGSDHALAEPDGAGVTWGLAEFVAAEEMGRLRGFWWSPDGRRLLAARVDETPVQRWHIADPAQPERPATAVAYPAAGTPNADVTLWLLDVAGEGPGRVEVRWDRSRFEYVVTARWDQHGCLLTVQSRDQRAMAVLAVDPDTGATTVLHEDSDPAWLEIVPGVPARLDDGRLVTTRDLDGARRLIVDGRAVTPDGLQVRSVVAAGPDVVLTASTEPTETHVWRWLPAGGAGSLRQVTSEPGVHGAATAGPVVVVSSATLGRHGTQVTVLRDGPAGRIPSYAETPAITPAVTLVDAGSRALRTAVLFPTGHQPGSRRLPVLLDPYGGPHAQRVVASRAAFLASQWLADQGFVVVVADGRGTPGRGPEWERAVAGDLASAPLEDQVDALHAVAERWPDDVDLGRVAIRGWSFGGYLAALAVLRRPDVFAAAIAGAPVTDWTLYDTHYTERYLGDPNAAPDVYAGSSLLRDAAALQRPLLLIHGLADDNVVAAHTLRLSSALLAAGRPHAVLPLSGVTHMTPQEVVAENLLLLQVAWLRDALALDRGQSAAAAGRP